MERWKLEMRALQPVLTHYCEHARPRDTVEALRQDISATSVRCVLCDEKFATPLLPGNPRLLLKLIPVREIIMDDNIRSEEFVSDWRT